MLIFGGLRFARGPLTGGQRFVLDHLRGPDHLERVVPVPSGVDLAGVYDAVHAMVCRHETLRTRFPAGGREQVVDGAGMLAVRTFGSVEEARAALGEPFDMVGEWGIRVAAVCQRGRPRAVVLWLARLAVDPWAADLVVDHLAALLSAPDRNREPPRRQPVDRAEEEHTPNGLARQADALSYLREVLLRAPAGEPAEPGQWHRGELRSGAVDPAARAVAARCRTTSDVVYLAAAAVGLGAGAHVLAAVTPNRLTDAESAYVAPLAQETFVPVEVSGERFDGVVARTCDAFGEASLIGCPDPAAVGPLVAEVTAARGSRPDVSVLVDDRRTRTRPPAGPVATTFRWAEPFPSPRLTRHLTIADDGTAVTLSLQANGDREQVPVFLNGMADLIIAAAGGDASIRTVNPGPARRARQP
jgi:hypothetical protein